MQGQIDVAKLVGVASAPVALIIATSIFLSNLGTKYAMMAGWFRQVSEEFRNIQDKNGLRAQSLQNQIGLYSHRLRLLMKATLWLTVSIICFIATVLFTSVSVLMPKVMVWPWVTVACSFAGMLLLGYSVFIEMEENRRAKEGLVLETAEFPDVLTEDLEQHKHQFRGKSEARPRAA